MGGVAAFAEAGTSSVARAAAASPPIAVGRLIVRKLPVDRRSCAGTGKSDLWFARPSRMGGRSGVRESGTTARIPAQSPTGQWLGRSAQRVAGGGMTLLFGLPKGGTPVAG